MKRLLISLLLVVANVYAASSSEQDVTEWTDERVHDVNGVRIETFLRADGGVSSIGTCLAARQVPWRYARKVDETTSFKRASFLLQQVLDSFENDMMNMDGATCCDWKVDKMLILVGLRKSGVKFRVEGSVDPKICQTFFPPYTIISEGSTELSEAEIAQERVREELSRTGAKLSEIVGKWNDEVDQIVEE